MKIKLKKYLFISLGILSLTLGFIGIFLPIFPTTPFLLLASFLFYKSSKKLSDWLLQNKLLGSYIYIYMTYKAVKRRVKITTIILVWISLSTSIYLMDNIYLRIMLAAIGIVITIHLLKIQTYENLNQ